MEREEAISWLTNEKWKNANNKYKKEWNEAFDMAIEALSPANLKEEFGSADAVSREAHYDAVANRITDMEERGFVSVVRCKDCRWWSCKDSLHQHNSHLCRYWKSTNTSADDFCSYGERRSNKREEVNGFKSVGQVWNTSQGRWEK